MRTGVIVVAAGSGARLGRAEPKAFVRVGDRTILEHALRGVAGVAHPSRVVVVVPADRVDQARAIAAAASLDAVVVVGGATRQESVASGLAQLGDDVEVVLVHDAARCLTPAGQFDRVAAAVAERGTGVVPALPMSDTVKRVDGASVLETVDRNTLVQVQTPQGFPLAALRAAYAAADREHTDDAAVLQAQGGSVMTVPGDPLAMKITTGFDLRRAEQLVGQVPALRTGIGTDVHAFDETRPLWLGGVYWPDEPGLAGHSDGDAVCHAICDALLSAAGLGDIGGRFGTAEERFRDAHGDVFVEATVELVTGAGYRIGNVAVQVIANRPKFASRRTELEQRLTGLIGAPVSIAATTADGLGFSGRGEGVAVVATALVQTS